MNEQLVAGVHQAIADLDDVQAEIARAKVRLMRIQASNARICAVMMRAGYAVFPTVVEDVAGTCVQEDN